MEQEQAATLAPRWATYAEIERLYGISRTRAWRLLKAGKIRAARDGRTVFINCSSVEDYLEKHTAEF